MPRIDLKRADSEPLEFERRLKLADGSGGVEVVSAGEIVITGVVEKGAKGYLLRGDVLGKAEMRCVRCLATFPLEYKDAYEIELQPLERAPKDEEVRLGRHDLDIRFYETPELDIGELAAEQFELALPMKPVCDETCRGLCVTCGANLNEGQCSCPPETDERWTPLADWRPSD